MQDSPRVFKIDEAATRLGCSRSHVYDLIAAGELRTVNISARGRSKTRIRSDDLADYIERRTVDTKGAA